MVNIYEKMNEARAKFHSRPIIKTGYNSFSKYAYFELADFLEPILEICKELKLFTQVSFMPDVATLTVTNTENIEEQIIFNSPMSTASLKACHEVQNLGAVETYIRRYLYSTAFEIIENDIVDKGEPTQEKKPAQKPKQENKQNQDELMTKPEIQTLWNKLKAEKLDQFSKEALKYMKLDGMGSMKKWQADEFFNTCVSLSKAPENFDDDVPF